MPIKPNILYLHSHDTGRYIQPYGHAMPTPRLQQLAEEGILFRRAFCCGPTCSPSRACLLTGQNAHNNGMLGLAHRGFGLTYRSRHMVHTLRNAGYVSYLSGVQHVERQAEEPWRAIGYDGYLGDKDVAHERASAFLDDAPQQPFFLSVGFGQTHRVYPEPSPEDNPNCCLPPALFPDTPETRRDMASFRTCVRVLDTKMGTVLDALERNGLADNTLVICTTDHGIAFPRMKCSLTDGGIGVMLIVRGPGGFVGGKACDALVSHIDVFPTLCDLLEIDRPDWLEGVSLMPLVRGEEKHVREEIFAELNYHACYEPTRCVRTDRWKYIRRFDARLRPVLANCDEGLTKTYWLENGWAEETLQEEELYDLAFDPNERHNLATEPGHAVMLEAMRERLSNWMRQTDDPVLRGYLPAPKGARINHPDCRAPNEKRYLKESEMPGMPDSPHTPLHIE